MTDPKPTPPKPVHTPWRVTTTYQGRSSSTTFGSEQAARDYAAAMRKRGVRASVRPV